LLDLIVTFVVATPRVLELHRTLDERVALGLELLDRAEQLADGVVTRHLGAQARVVRANPAELTTDVLVLAEEKLRVLDPLSKERAHECFAFLDQVHGQVASATLVCRVAVDRTSRGGSGYQRRAPGREDDSGGS
jgi:hypothetical protein